MRNSCLWGEAKNPHGSNSARNARSQRVVHGVGQTAVQALDDVGVGAEGDGDASVAEEFLNVFRVLACHEEYCSAGVTEVVKPDLGQLCSLFNRA
jgi:hypothetical protein